MKTKTLSFVSKLTTAAMVASMFAVSMPVHAAAITAAHDTMGRLATGATGVVHAVVLTPAAAASGALALDYSTVILAGSGASLNTTGSVGCTAPPVATELLGVIHLDEVGGCTSIHIGFAATNAPAAGTQTVTVAGAHAGVFAVALTADDQIVVTASVNPVITFQVNADSDACSHGESTDATDHSPSTDGGTVALGLLSPLTIGSSDDNGVNHICTFVSTNAASGYSLSVQSANGQLLKEAGVAIPTTAQSAADVTLSAGTPAYGLCLSTETVPNMDETDPIGSQLVGQGSGFSGNTCSGVDTAEHVGALTTSAQTIGHNTGKVQESAAQWLVKAAIASTTIAGAYTDTLTFIATGTF